MSPFVQNQVLVPGNEYIGMKSTFTNKDAKRFSKHIADKQVFEFESPESAIHFREQLKALDE